MKYITSYCLFFFKFFFLAKAFHKLKIKYMLLLCFFLVFQSFFVLTLNFMHVYISKTKKKKFLLKFFVILSSVNYFFTVRLVRFVVLVLFLETTFLLTFFLFFLLTFFTAFFFPAVFFFPVFFFGCTFPM